MRENEVYVKWFRKKVPVESLVLGFLQSIPSLLDLFSRENDNSANRLMVTDKAILEAIPGMFLFLIGEHFPYSEPKNIQIMERAFQCMWAALPTHGIPIQHAHNWFETINEELIITEGNDRMLMAANALSRKWNLGKPIAGQSPTWYLAFLIRSSIRSIPEYRVV